MFSRYTALLGAIAAIALPMASASAQTALKWAHVYETSEPFHTESVWAAEEIEKRTDGRYKIDVFPASQLGKEADINQGLTLGTVDIIISGSSFAAREFPPIGVTYYPFTFRDADHLLAYTKSDNYKELTERLRGSDPATTSPRPPITARAIRPRTGRSPNAPTWQGLKMRVPDVPAYLAMPRACGANTAPIAFAEVYLALQNGTVEAQENPLTTIEAKKFYEVQKHIVLTGHIVDHLNTIVSKTRWAELSDEDKADLHRGDAGSGRARHQDDRGAREGAGPDLQGPRPDRDRGRQGGLREERDGKGDVRGVRLPTRQTGKPSSAIK